MPKKLEISKINIDMSVLPRKADDQETIDQYAETMRKGVDELPPIDVFFDGKTHWLGDGLYRIKSAQKIGETTIPCNIHKGDHSAARWHAAGANITHGKPLTQAQKRHAARMLVNDPTNKKKSSVVVAAQCGVGVAMIQGMRKLQADTATTKAKKAGTKPPEAQTRTVTTKAGTTYDRGPTGGKGGGRPSKAKARAKAKAVLEDGLGFPIPDRLRPVAEDAYTLTEFQTAIGELAKKAQKLHDLSSGAGQFLDMKKFAASIQQQRTLIADATFYCACPECGSKKASPKACSCKGVGWLTDPQYKKLHLEAKDF